MKIRNKLPKGSIILFLVVMLLDLCVLMIISNYLEVSYLTEKVRLIYGEITVSFFISFIIGFSYWFHCRFDFIEAGRIMGASKIQIAINLISEFGTAVLAGSVAGSLLTMAARFFGIIKKMNMSVIIIVFLLIFLTGTVFTYINLCRTLKYGRIRALRFHDAMLVVQFVVFFVLFIEIGTYYVNIDTQKWVENEKMGYKFYTLQNNDDKNTIHYENQPDFYKNVRNAIAQIDKQKDFMYMRADMSSVSADVDFDGLKKHLKKNDYRLFTTSAQESFGDVDFADEPEESESGRKIISLAVCQMDKNASDIYLNQLDKGRKFNKKDFIYNFEQKTFPVVLGNEYEKYYKLGETFGIKGFGKAKITGFLKKNAEFISDRTLEQRGGNKSLLDYYIIMPIFDIKDDAHNSSQKFFMQMNYFNFDNGTIVMSADSSNADVISVQKKINEILRDNHLNVGYCVNSTPAIITFLNQSEKFVNTLFLFVILIAVSNAFSFMLNITVKIELNKDKFGIQLMNGRSRKMILIEFAGNILMLVFIAAVAAAYIIRAYFYQNIIFAVILAAEAAGSVLLGILVLGIKLSGTDVELLMREQNG